ncbi:MAG: hypothetical protein KDE03_07370 [Rhodobacteraceae bacterium]|nr:hypothetical protein [Paracoccaceae bacterium]
MQIVKLRRDISLATLRRVGQDLSEVTARGVQNDSLVQRALTEVDSEDAATMAAVDSYVQLMRSRRAKLGTEILKATEEFDAAKDRAALSFGAVKALEAIGKARPTSDDDAHCG